MKPKISVVVPTHPGRIDRLRAILTRLSLSLRLYNRKFPKEQIKAKELEFIIVDGGSTTESVKQLCAAISRAHSMKYVYLPIKRFINCNYPRNVALRLIEGDVIIYLDVDHFPSENIVEGAYKPFMDGRIDKHICRFYIIDSSRSKHPSNHGGTNPIWLENLNRFVLNSTNLKCKIDDLFEKAMIPRGTNNTLWAWSAKRQYIVPLQGYDEVYCRAYGRDEDDFRQRMLAAGLHLWDGSNKFACAIHLWHEQAARKDPKNQINKEYFNKIHGSAVMNVQYAKSRIKDVRANKGWEWGKLLKGSFSYINGEYMDSPQTHEHWIKDNIQDVPNYTNSNPWENVDDFLENLDKYCNSRKI